MNKEKLLQAVYRLAAGDAIGVPYEFMRRGTFVCTGMDGNGSHDKPVGTWSDDTALTLATVKSILDNSGKIDVEDMRKNFIAWMNEGAFTPDGDRAFGIGRTTLFALVHGYPGRSEYDMETVH